MSEFPKDSIPVSTFSQCDIFGPNPAFTPGQLRDNSIKAIPAM